jgi:hypothetical protein
MTTTTNQERDEAMRETERKLFILSAMLSKQDGLQTKLSLMQGYRVRATDEEAKGAFLDAIMNDKPDYAIQQVLCMEVPKDVLADPPPPTNQEHGEG